MPGRRGFALSILTAASLLAAACGEPPEKEMQQARGAIDAARAAGAEQYAREELTAAEAALKRAQDAVGQRDYRLALNYALDSREQAQNAAKETANHKATARADADHALIDAVAALADARLKLKAAESARVAPARLTNARTTIADGEEAVQKARAAFNKGDYLAVTDAVAGATSRLRVAARDLEAAVPASAHRRR
jgi:flagellar hook-basal body complex protein FliE